MQISSNGIQFLKREEGERLRAYRDTRGIWTIGVGHTGYVDGVPVSSGVVIDADKSTELLLKDLSVVERTLRQQVNVILTQNQYDALCSLVFNIGSGAFSTSTVKGRLNAEDYAGAADAFLMWRRAGTDSEILLPRRRREYALFLS